MINENVTYSDSFGVEFFPKETRKFIGNNKITTHIYRMFIFMIQKYIDNFVFNLSISC